MASFRHRIPATDITRVLVSACAGVASAMIAAYIGMPPTREWLGADNGYLAWTAAVTFALTAVSAAGLLMRASALPRTYAAVTVVGVAGALDAGFITIGVSPPVVAGIEVDGGSGLLRVAHAVGLTPLLIVAPLLFATAWGWAAHRRGTLRRIAIDLADHRPLFLTLLSAVALVTAWAVGAAQASPHATFTEGLVTLIAAAVLGMAATAMAEQRRTVAQWRRRIRAWNTDGASRIAAAPEHRHDPV